MISQILLCEGKSRNLDNLISLWDHIKYSEHYGYIDPKSTWMDFMSSKPSPAFQTTPESICELLQKNYAFLEDENIAANEKMKKAIRHHIKNLQEQYALTIGMSIVQFNFVEEEMPPARPILRRRAKRPADKNDDSKPPAAKKSKSTPKKK